MSLITPTVKKNAAKCEECPVVRGAVGLDKKNFFYDETRSAMGVTCKLCPNLKDFEKIYGMMPIMHYGNN